MPAVALTDHGTMFGVIDFYNAATSAGIKPIVGVESYLAPRGMSSRDPQFDKKSTHLLLLAENAAGYKNLLKIASAAQLDGFYYYPRIDHQFLAEHAEGLICTSGCMSAEVPRLISQGDMEGARRQLDWYYSVFGAENFFLELQQHDIQELDNINKMLVDLGRRYQARFVATNDVHYINKEDARLQDILLAVQTGCLLKDPNRMRMTDNSYYLRSAEEMARLFADVPEALSNTLLIAERCNLDLGFKGYHLPEFEVPQGYTAETYLRELCEAGLQRRYAARATDPVVRKRLDYELGVIHQMGFDTYFLIVWDLCRYAREQGIWYNARGSAAGSIVAYTLDITLVDPIEHGLIFERFLNPGRISMPDIDLDFRDDRRAEMMEYTARKYGDDKVAQIITFGTMGARAAIRDVGRVMDIQLSEVDKVAKLIPNIPGKPVTIEQALVEVTEFKQLYQNSPHLRELIDTAKHMEGVVRNAGTHAAGVIITDKPVIEYIPLHRPTGNSAADSPVKTVTQFEMSILDSLGLLKVDFLGLATLTIMARACDLICQRHGVEFNLDNIPTDDPATYELLGRGETAAVFQVEGSGMRRYLMQMKPKELANVIAMVALFRPGPMDFIPGYIRRMHGDEEVDYRHPALEPIFQETYGYPVYQEQLMFAVMNLAGYTAPEADDLRKAISKKMKEKLQKHREKFVSGATKQGISRETASAIFDDWEEFARYGFNKCLPGEVEIVDPATGRVVKIEDLYNGTQVLSETITCDTGSLRLGAGRVSTVMFNGVKPVYRLRMASGRSIEATANHPFYTYAGWRNLEALRVDEFVAVPRRLPVEGRREWPEHEVIALGHLLAEGNLRHPHSVYFYNQDEAQVEDFVAAAEKFSNVRCSVATHKDTFTVYARRIDRRQLPGIMAWAQGLGIWGKNAREKEIPAAAFELANRQIGLLISRMWEGDGHIDLKGRSLYYATASERLARQLQHLFLRLNIITRLRKVVFPYKEGRTGYQLFITGRDNIAAFGEQVGVYFLSERRKATLEILCQSGPGRGSKDIIPVEVKELVRTAKERQGITWMQLNAESGIAQREFYPANSAGKAGFTRATLGRLAVYFDDPELQRYAENDIYWDRITEIEYVGEKPTYDLEVPGNHNFVANDILVHNSHAVDYGVISVQTAYLKTHYPVEYMTAVLSVTKNDTAKVALYVADCRRMGIAVEPPDINASQWDFGIEDRPDQTPVIRFGLGAVKNVGQGPVDTILKVRAEGPFVDLNDFARRVDLRQVGKRALESLVRVGAMDRFGSRIALLDALDRIVSVSTSHFRAAESGQMSMFGAHTGIVENIALPNIGSDISRREILNWERELIGLYVSDHPLSPVMSTLTEIVTHFSGQLAEVSPTERVRVAGLITRVRHHQSKAGKPMAFVTLEDLQGTIELVIFPRTWEKVSEIVDFDRIVVVDGRVDAEGAEPKVLVDNLTTEISVITPADAPPGAAFTGSLAERPVERTPEPGGSKAGYSPAAGSSRRVADEALQPDAEPGDWESGLPPQPEPPPGWDLYEISTLEFGHLAKAGPPEAPQPVSGEAGMEPQAVETPAPAAYAEAYPAGGEPEPEPAAAQVEPQSGPQPAPELAPQPVQETPPQLADEPPKQSPGLAQYLVPPAAIPEDDGEVHMITIILRSTGDKTRDVLRLRRIYGMITTYPGNDRFGFHVFERGRGYLLEFPNSTAGFCPELMARLTSLVGPENVRVEKILFQ